MKTILLTILLAALPAARAGAAPYFHTGLNQVNGGYFVPVAGAEKERQAGLIMPVIEHDQADGYLLIPGVSWNLLNLGYIGDTSTLRNFLNGKVAAGPSVVTGDLVKKWMRWGFSMLPEWDQDERYGFLKSLTEPGQRGFYADVGVYEALAINRMFPISKAQPETVIGATLNKRF